MVGPNIRRSCLLPDYRRVRSAVALEVACPHDACRGFSAYKSEILKEFPGFHDEKLKGNRKGQRSSRHNLQYRVIYVINGADVRVYVLELTPHKY